MVGPTSPQLRARPLGHGRGGLVWVDIHDGWWPGRVLTASRAAVSVAYLRAGGWIATDEVPWSDVAAHVRLQRVAGLDEWLDDVVVPDDGHPVEVRTGAVAVAAQGWEGVTCIV